MKLFIDYGIADKIKRGKMSGKGKFLLRLIHALEDLGVKAQFSAAGAHVALGISYWRNGRPKIPHAIRVDGVHYLKSKQKIWINKQVRKSVKCADAVIWQSHFAKNEVSKALKVTPKREYVIFNGADSSISEAQPAYSNYVQNVLMCARFKGRPQKGLKGMLRLANEYVQEHPDVGFWVAGMAEHSSPHKNIHMLGHLPTNKLSQYMKMCDALLYLASYDWCPNSVVESLVAGLPVVYLRGSGVEELVGDNGIGIDQDGGFQISADTQSAQPRYCRNAAAHALLEVLTMRKPVECEGLTIKHAAQKYKEVFDSIAR